MSDSDIPDGAIPPEYQAPSYNNCDDVSPFCPVEATVYGDYFSLGGCAFFVAVYSLLLIAQAYLAVRSRAWTFAVYLAIGTIFELMGYAARIALSDNPWIYDAFVIQLVMLILGPTLVAASISVTFKHLVLWYGREWSFIKPVLYPWIFVGTDFFSIIIQAVGGVVSAIATGGDNADESLLDTGSALLIAGVVFQMANMVFCGGLMVYYLWNRHRGLKRGQERLQTAQGDGPDAPDAPGPYLGPMKPAGPSDRKTKIFLYAITVAYVAIIIRCVYRIPEQEKGWGNELMQNETTFLILDGAMILISVLCLTIFHPCFFFPFLSKSKDKKVSAGPPPAEGGMGAEEHEMGTVPDSRHGAP